MNDELWRFLVKRAVDGGEIEQVELRPGQAADTPGARELRRGLDEVVADESAGAGDPSE